MLDIEPGQRQEISHIRQRKDTNGEFDDSRHTTLINVEIFYNLKKIMIPFIIEHNLEVYYDSIPT